MNPAADISFDSAKFKTPTRDLNTTEVTSEMCACNMRIALVALGVLIIALGVIGRYMKVDGSRLHGFDTKLFAIGSVTLVFGAYMCLCEEPHDEIPLFTPSMYGEDKWYNTPLTIYKKYTARKTRL